MNVQPGMYTRQSKVHVFPASRQADGEMVVIGRIETGKFVALPPDAVEVLDHLAAGRTVGEAQDLYQKKYGEIPDMEELLRALDDRGIVALQGGRKEDGDEERLLPGGGTARKKFHFANVPQSFAHSIFNRYTVVGTCLLAALTLLLIRLEPSILPGRSALYYAQHRTLKTLILIGISLVTVFAHEMGHLLAARAVGVSSRMGLGNRYWVLVAETDLTGLWSLPRRRRYLPLLGGPLVDIASASVVVLTLFAHQRGWLPLHPGMLEILRSMVVLYAFGLLWQCFFFVRTDLYYVIGTFFGCKSLMSDTRALLRNLLSRVIPALRRVDQSAIPRREMWVIRGYLPVLLLGRVLAILTLVRVTIPLIGRYLGDIASVIIDSPQAGYEYWDTLTVPVCYLLPIFIGVGLWMKQLARRKRRQS